MKIKKTKLSIISSSIEFFAIILIPSILAAVLLHKYALLILAVAGVISVSLSVYIYLNFKRYEIKIDNNIMVVQSGVMFKNKNIIDLSAHSSNITIKTPISRLFSVVSVILFFQSGIFIIYSVDEKSAESITAIAKGAEDENKTSLFNELL